MRYSAVPLRIACGSPSRGFLAGWSCANASLAKQRAVIAGSAQVHFMVDSCLQKSTLTPSWRCGAYTERDSLVASATVFVLFFALLVGRLAFAQSAEPGRQVFVSRCAGC